MDFTYTWKVTGLKVRDQVNADGETLPSAVVQTYWECTGANADGVDGTFSGATPFTAENVPAGSFKAFADLAEADVLAWIQNRVNGDRTYKLHIDQQIQKQIEDKAGVVSEINAGSFPWSGPEDAVTPTPGASDPDADGDFTDPEAE
jgi:hypothetical protein